MIPAAFDYHSPQSLDEALSLLKQHGGDAKILAGGQSLIPAMRFRLAVPAILIDINQLNDLRYVEERGDHLAIGAMTREHSLEDSSAVRSSYPLLHDTAVVIADHWCETKRRLAETSRTRTRPTTIRPRCWPTAPRSVVAKGPNGGARTIRRRRVLHGPVSRTLHG